MFRKTGIGLAALAMLAPGLAAALGVGDYTLNSYLNQPLVMEVELFDAGDLTPEEVLANLGSEGDFQNAGVERVFFLNELSFEVNLRQDGNGTLRITSAQPVREPFLNFIVEIMWPTGRLLREYTVLLDPPVMAEAVQPSAVAPVVSQSTAPAPVQAPVQQVEQPAQTQSGVVAQSQSFDASRGPDYVVQPSDTMWRIALNNRPANSISVQQMLIAIQTLNPEAFIDGNVNLVREGTVLRIPSEQEVRQISTRDALVEVAEQNREWRAKLEARGIAVPTRPQLDGTGSGRRAADTGVATEGQVKLVSPDAVSGEGSGRGAGGTGGADASALQNELAIRDENVDRLNRQNNELQSRLKDLQDQVTTSEQLLNLRNDQINQLQQQLRELQIAQGITPSEPVVIEPVPEAALAPQVEGVPADGAAEPGSTLDPIARAKQATAALEAATGAGSAANDPNAAARDAAAMDAGVATTPEEIAAAKAAAALDSGSADPAEVAAALEAAGMKTTQGAPARPAPAPAPAAEPGIVDTIMANLMLIVAGVLVLVVVIGGMAWMRNRQQAANDDESLEEYQAHADAEVEDDFFVDNGDFAEDLDDSAPGASESAQDPLEEVDVYTAYGRHAEAVTFLRNEIHKAPQREDLKVRLLEVLAEMHDRENFEREATAFAGAGATVAAAVTSLRARFPGGASDAEPSLDDLEMDLASDFDAPATRASAPADDELDLDLGGDDGLGSLDFDMGESKTVAAPALSDDDELSLDFGGEEELSLEDEGLSLDLGDDQEDALTLEPEQELSLDVSADDGDELSLELDSAEDELSLELDSAPASASALELDDVSVDLSEDNDFGELSLADMSDEFSETAVEQSSEEIDLSLDDLSLDDEPTEVSMPALQPAATVQREPVSEPSVTVQRDAVDLDELSLDDDSTSVRQAVEPALEQALTGDDDDFDFLGDTDENATKLDLAKAYIDMGDSEGARDILQEVMSEGNPQQQQEAKQLLSQVG
ncbi:MAG: peptigoglycan-binding protein LysM [Alcanivoracaceae bacterium]|nr:peptigoglycan-binding protein LysM [Alcanivoracaceae bacterium]